MQFESLANELLLDIFDYFNIIHLFRAFHGLNARLDRLLLIHFHAYAVDFQSVSKHDFNIFCRKYLPLITERVVSLRLSDDNETPDQPNHFLSDYFTISQFPCLKFLKLHGLGSINLLLKMISSCRDLSCLTHLKITEFYFQYDDDNFNDLINNIWALPKLTHCHLDSNFLSSTSLIKPTLISSSIEYLSMKSIEYLLDSLVEILEHTPHLQHLCGTLQYQHVSPELFTVAPLITRLTMVITYSLFELSYLFKMMPNLSHVTLEIRKRSDHSYLNGDQWEHVIVENLSNIKVFRFFVSFHPSQPIYNMEKHIDKVLDTFRTPFWLNEHRWFVRCEWDPQVTDGTISLYTLPNCFGDCYALYPTIRSKSTCTTQDVWSYNDMYHIICKNDDFDWGPSCVLFPKIGHLKVRFPTDHKSWSFILTLDHLTSLKVSLDNKTSLSQLQALIDRAPRLYSLAVQNASASQLAQLKIIHTRLRRVSLAKYCFNAPECSLFASSPLGRQCEVLSIDVTDRRHIPGLINEMPNLRALRCYCEDNKWELDESLSSVTDDVVKWLQDRLPSTCSISSRMIEQLDIRVWLD